MAQVYANIFGVKFPVCNEQQKTDIEAAFQEALTYRDAEQKPEEICGCDLIIRLLRPNPSRMTVLVAAQQIAMYLYRDKEEAALKEMVMMMLEENQPVQGRRDN